VVEGLKPIQARYNEIAGEGGYLDEVLAKGADHAATVAHKILSLVQERVGFLKRA